MVDQDPDYESERKRLQELLLKTALELSQHTKTAAFSIRVPKTTPPVFLAFGEAKTIRQLLGQ